MTKTVFRRINVTPVAIYALLWLFIPQISAQESSDQTVEMTGAADLDVASTLERLTDVYFNFLIILPALLVSLFVFVFIASIGHFWAKWHGFWRTLAPNMFMAEILAQAVRLAFMVLGVVIALEMMGAGKLIGAILGAAGITGIAIGFAVKDTVDNYVSSLMLSFNQPFRPNDLIQIDTMVGRVIRMTSRATILMTPDGNHLRIPNAKVYKSPITNFTRIPERRLSFDIGVHPSDDPQAAIQCGIAAIRTLPFIASEPGPNGFIKDLGPSTIDLVFRGWIDQGDTSFTLARSLALRAVKMALEENGFSIPDPSYVIRIDAASTPVLFDDVSDGIMPPAKPEDAPIKLDNFDSAKEAKADHFIQDKVQEERERLTADEDDMLRSERPEE